VLGEGVTILLSLYKDAWKYSAVIMLTCSLSIACNRHHDAVFKSTNVLVSAELPAGIIRLVEDGQSVQARINYGGQSRAMHIGINQTATGTIEHYQFAHLELEFIIAIKGDVLIPLLQSSQSADMAAVAQNIVSIDAFTYPDSDGDGYSNLIEWINHTDWKDPVSIPDNGHAPMTSTSYTMTLGPATGQRQVSSSNTYTLSNFDQTVFSAQQGKSYSDKTVDGQPLYELKTLISKDM